MLRFPASRVIPSLSCAARQPCAGTAFSFPRFMATRQPDPEWKENMKEMLERNRKDHGDTPYPVLATADDTEGPLARYHRHGGFVADEKKESDLVWIPINLLGPSVYEVEAWWAYYKGRGSPCHYLLQSCATSDRFKISGGAYVVDAPPSPDEQAVPDHLWPGFDWEKFRERVWGTLPPDVKAAFGVPEDSVVLEPEDVVVAEVRGYEAFGLIVVEPRQVERTTRTILLDEVSQVWKMKEGRWVEDPDSAPEASST